MDEVYTYRNFAYLDTNILSYLAKKLRDRKIVQVLQFRDYLLEKDLTVAISEAHMLELSDADRLYEPLAVLLVTLPSALIKAREAILREEVKAHPLSNTESILAQRLNPLIVEPNGLTLIQENSFSKDYVTKARNEQLSQAGQLRRNHSKLKPNFPASEQGKYPREEAELFANVMLMEALQGLYKDFLAQFKDDVSKLNFENFPGVRLRAMAIFYKYYLGGREPRKTSELGDFGHLYYVPYCKLAVMENDLCNILKQIQKNQGVIAETKIENISFIRNIVEGG